MLRSLDSSGSNAKDRLSLAAALLWLCVVGCSRSDSQLTARTKKQPAPVTEGESETDAPSHQAKAPIFIDATEAAGIDFTHVNGGVGEYWLPEITGAGAALFDYDNDGDLDVYLVQGTWLKPDSAEAESMPPPSDRFYHNELIESGELRFRDATEAAGIQAQGYGMGVACADYDNDGWVDLYVTNLSANQLFRNTGNGNFVDVTQTAGVAVPKWSTSAAFIDYDRDGWLDLFVSNYVDFSVDLQRRCFARNSARDYCGPDSFDPLSDRLLRNRGDGTFEDVTAASGIGSIAGAGLGVVCADFNQDGYVDIYVANDGDPNQMWINQQGTGSFEDNALLAGTALNRMGNAEAGMGVDAADFDSDGDVDLFMTHLESESNTLYSNSGNGMFEDKTIEFGLHTPSLSYTSFGTRFFDYNNDGWLDLIALNGAVRVVEALARQGDAYPLHQPNQLFENNQGRGFIEITQQAGAAFALSEVSRGGAFGDIDNDGDADFVVLNNNGRARLFLNEVGNQRHWIGLRLLDQDGKRDNLHARVEVTRAGSAPLWRSVRTDGGYCSSNDPRVIIGLDRSDDLVNVHVHFADRPTYTFGSLSTGCYWELRHGQEPRKLGKGT
jgi:hypothetical protein